LHLSDGLLSSWSAQQSARTTTESDGAALAVIEHLDGLHLDIAHDPRGGIVAVGGEREAAVEQDPRGVELHAGGTVEHEADLGERDSAHAGEVVAGVELAVGGGGAVRRHPSPERDAQRPVRRQREARDRGARVQRRAGGEHRRRHVEPLPGDDDGLESDHVHRRSLRVLQHGSQRVPGPGRPRHAEDEEAMVAGCGREAVGEDGAEAGLRLRRQRLHAAAERHDPRGLEAEPAPRGVAAAELKSCDLGSKRVPIVM
jgi:hypothetical protein